jgi:hypothetical protein
VRSPAGIFPDREIIEGVRSAPKGACALETQTSKNRGLRQPVLPSIRIRVNDEKETGEMIDVLEFSFVNDQSALQRITQSNLGGRVPQDCNEMACASTQYDAGNGR